MRRGSQISQPALSVINNLHSDKQTRMPMYNLLIAMVRTTVLNINVVKTTNSRSEDSITYKCGWAHTLRSRRTFLYHCAKRVPSAVHVNQT